MRYVFLTLWLILAIPCSCFANERTYIFLKTVLDNMTEYWQHHIGVEGGTYDLMVSPNGKDEAVFYKGLLLKDDWRNVGTYNCYPYKMGTKHFLVDTYSWLLFGITQDDTSTPEERWEAWTHDFLDSFNKVCYNHPELFNRKKDLTRNLPEDTFLEIIFEPLLQDKKLETLFTNAGVICAYDDGDIEKILVPLKRSLQNVFKDKIFDEKILKMCTPVLDESIKCHSAENK